MKVAVWSARTALLSEIDGYARGKDARVHAHRAVFLAEPPALVPEDAQAIRRRSARLDELDVAGRQRRFERL